MDYRGKVAIGTGASSGVGRATGRAFARRGSTIVAVDGTLLVGTGIGTRSANPNSQTDINSRIPSPVGGAALEDTAGVDSRATGAALRANFWVLRPILPHEGAIIVSLETPRHGAGALYFSGTGRGGARRRAARQLHSAPSSDARMRAVCDPSQ